VAERSNTWVCSRSPAGIAGLNPAEGMDVCLLWVLCVCQVEVSATGWSLVQRSPTDCGASLCEDLETSRLRRLKTRKWVVKAHRWLHCKTDQYNNQPLHYRTTALLRTLQKIRTVRHNWIVISLSYTVHTFTQCSYFSETYFHTLLQVIK
jgi:hypothetical protein